MTPTITNPVASTLALNGELTLKTVTNLWNISNSFFAETKSPILLDLQNVTQSDSAGVALLIAWVRYVRQQNKEISLINLPAQMSAIINISGLNKILPINTK